MQDCEMVTELIVFIGSLYGVGFRVCRDKT